MSKIEPAIKTSNQLTLDSRIYKVKLLLNGSLNVIYVFYGKKYTKNDDEDELFKRIFTDEENEQIKKDSINIKFSEQQIHFDDSIGIIKLKILNELKRDISLDEIYLYCQKFETINAVTVYQSLTQNNKLQLTKVRLDQFISNIISDENGALFISPEPKEIYTFDDIFEMKFANNKYIVDKVLGQKFFIVENEYPFISNPYKVNEYDRFFENNARKTLTTLNSHLLLNSGNIIDNSIYLCLADDVISYLGEKNISEDTTIKIYYPFLYNKNINSAEDLTSNRSKLIEGNKKFLTENTFNSFKTIDMFYDVYKLRKNELNYVNKGIKYIKAVIKPDFNVKIPLEIIFKVVHATHENPLIKYNPSTRQENVYRLFTDKISTDGRKIPYLKKAVILKLMKNIARNKSVAVYIETGLDQTLICEFDEEGFITIYSEFKSVVSVDEIDDIFKKYINPIIQEIKVLLEQSGYKLNTFNSLNDENVEIKQLTYETQISITKPLNIEAFSGCISSIFINETNAFKGSTISLRFKRVSNYSKFNSQEAFILEKSNQGLRGDQIIEALLENFSEDLNKQQAMEMVRKIANELEIERGVRKSDIIIKNNPGFKTIISLQQESGIITITTENINSINYLYTLPIYLDSMVRLTQDKKSTHYSVKEINHLCSTGNKKEISTPDIISIVEESAPNSKVPSINTDEDQLHYTKFKTVDIDKPKGALSLFFNEDEDEDKDNDEEPFLGGETSSEDKNTYAGVTVPNGVSSSSVESEKLDSPIVKDKSISSKESSIESEKLDSPIVKDKSISSKESILSEKSPEELDSFGNTDSDLSNKKSESIKTSSDIVIPSIVPTPESKEDEVKEDEVKEDEEKEDEVKEDEEKEDEEKEDEVKDEESEEEEDEIKNIDGMKLNKPYYFQTLIEKKDPVLILKEDTPQYNSYPRTCSSNMRRQPVILTDNQLEKINKQHPNFLRKEDVIKYGSDPKNKFNYICPRYWCLKNNTLIDPNDLKEVINKAGEKELVHPTCGKVLPKGEKEVKHGYYIYEFYKPKPGKKDYKKYPGLIPDSHPDGHCLPCCFEKYNTEGRIKDNDKCLDNKEEKEKKATKIADKEEDEYIKGQDKFPLESGRWGYLPVEIQIMLHEVNADCQISKTNTNIKENYPCLLRHGIEVNNKQSFVACISDVIFYAKKIASSEGKKVAKILNIKEMRERIIKSITIDTFIKYQNGNLVTDFHDPDRKVDINKYNNTKLFSKLDMDKPEDNAYFSNVVSAFENFISFLQDDDALIDHTYLWDIISIPNKYLFPNGVNLVIFQLPKDDITNNVQLLCPTNHYSSEFYEARKPTIILIKEDNYYEPIYSFTTNKNNITVAKEFKEYDPHLSKTMKVVFKEIIRPFFNIICRPLDSMPNVYKAKRPLLLYNLIQKLDKYEYKVQKLVLNFNNKVIGVIVEEPDSTTKSGFIPCYPSSLDENLKHDLDFVFMTDLSLWNTYKNTVQFLNKLDKRSKKRRNEPDIPCKPAFKVIEDEHVVGILTNTNQFIQLSEPIRLDEIDHELDIPSITNDNYIINTKAQPMVQSEVEIATQHGIDKERVDYIKKIRLETSFYNVFRNTIRIMINDYENVTIREKLEEEMAKEYIIYTEKLKNIDKLLRDLVKDKIQFIGDDNYYKLINEVSTCLVKDTESCTGTPNLCAVTENGKCNLILSEKNLITNKINEPIYYGRMADELIRYNRIKSFMFQPQTYLSFGNIGYNLRDNEIILIQSLLTQEYFESLIPAITNKYINYNSYDEVQPIITQVYDNIITSLDHAVGRNNEMVCEKKINKHIISSMWKKCFPEKYNEIQYSNFNVCTFHVIIDLIERKTDKKLTINQVKNELYEEYKKYLDNYANKMIDILIIEGKKNLGDQVKSEILSFSSLIYTDNYFLTTFDLWLLVTKHKIPTIFICQKLILQTKYEKHEFVGYGDENDKFVFIIIPGFRAEIVPSYKLVQTDEGDIFISLDKLNEDCVERIRETIHNKVTIETYLDHFTKPVKTYEKKKSDRLIIESDSDEEVKPKTVKPKKIKKPLIIEEPISEEFILNPSKKKVILKGRGTQKNKK